MVILIKLKNKKDIVEIVKQENLTNIVIETGNDNIFIPEENKFIVKDNFLANAPNLFNNKVNKFLKLETIDFSNFDFSEIRTMNGWFQSLATLQNVYFPKVVKANKLKSFSSCFARTKIKHLDLSNWNLSKAVTFSHLCENNKEIQSLILPNCQISSIRAMVNGCVNLQTIDFNNSRFTFKAKNNFPFSDYDFCFCDCKSLTTINCSKMDISDGDLKEIFSKEIENSLPKDCVILQS